MSKFIMNHQQRDLYQRLQAFSLDTIEDRLSFSKRLAKENRWSLDYTHRVIEEYKKFAFLAVVAGHSVSPSDQIDQVWHLHLTYTKSYWQEFCPHVLQTPLHHEPSRGGTAEKAKFDDWYRHTLDSYKQFFDQVPPSDIWTPVKLRCGRDLHFVRVNTQQNWVVPKLSLRGFFQVNLNQTAIFSILFLLTFIVSGCQGIATLPNPLNFTGPEFLTFYITTMVIIISLAACLRYILLKSDENPSQNNVALDLDVYETAYLTSDANRVVDTAIVNLVQQGYVTILTQAKMLVLSKPIEQLSHPLEKAVAVAIKFDGQIEKIRQNTTVILATNAIKQQLQQLGLFVSESKSFQSQFYPGLMIAVLLGLGIAKIFVGISRDKPVGYLIMLCILTGIIGSRFFFKKAYRSSYGDRILKKLRDRTRRQEYSNSDPQLLLAFALFGTTVLADSYFADLNKIFNPPSSGDGGGGCGGGGCGGGGCGGGGCGGG